MIMKNRLGLTDQQVTELTAVFKKHQEAASPLRQEVKAKARTLAEELRSTEPNPTTVGQLVIRQHALRTQLRNLNTKLQSDVLGMLTPEQKQKLEKRGLFGIGRPPRIS